MPATFPTRTDDDRHHICQTIARAIWRELLWLFPHDREVRIRVHGENIDVNIQPPPDPAPTPSNMLPTH